MQTIRSSQKIVQLGGKEALNLERRNARLECREALNCWLLPLGCVCRSLDMESDRWRKLDEHVQLQSKTFSADEYFAKWSDDMQPKYVWHSDSVVRIAHLVSHLVCCLVCCKITIIWFWPMQLHLGILEGGAYWTLDIGYIWVTNTSLIFIIVMTKQHREYKILRQFLGGGS